MAGSIGPSGMLPSSDDPALSGISFAGLAETFREQAAALVEGGADLILIETQQDILETRAAIDGARAAFRELGRSVPLQVQVALDVTGRMLLGTDVGAVLAILHGMRADVIGVNCSVGPEHLREPVRYLCQHAPGPVSVIPNAGLPRNVDGVASYPLGPDDMARELRAVRLGVRRARRRRLLRQHARAHRRPASRPSRPSPARPARSCSSGRSRARSPPRRSSSSPSRS